MTSEINQSRQFLRFVAYTNKNDLYFVVLDSTDSFVVLDRDLNLKNLIKTSSSPQDAPQITSFSKQGSALLFTRQNQINFLHVSEGRVGPVSCSVAHDTVLSSA